MNPTRVLGIKQGFLKFAFLSFSRFYAANPIYESLLELCYYISLLFALMRNISWNKEVLEKLSIMNNCIALHIISLFRKSP